ncbi:MAG: M18 family aminopeptidase [Actinomycetaceae bacterium]|nr:M18 family aminopeptidase [Arcanobacterium sp.]MDD7504804.1 M18 family aminopeptidase [Actinomycetaceae bacterium]
MTQPNNAELKSSFTANYAAFISQSPTAYHAQHVLAQKFQEAGLSEQHEKRAWAGAPRGFVARGGAVIAWQLPEEITETTGFRIVGSHLDSPSFKVKPSPDSAAHGFHQVNVEVYGGPLLNSWLNRDLGLAGVITTIDGAEHLVKTPAIMTIPQLAPHLDRSANRSLELSAQRDYHPIWALDHSAEFGEESDANHPDVFAYLAREAGVAKERVAGMDVFAYDTQPPATFGGADGTEFFASGRQDNLSSAFAAAEAFTAIVTGKSRIGALGSDVLIYASFNNEEVGSQTFTGANSAFLENVLKRIAAHLSSKDSATSSDFDERYLCMLANSVVISADAGHSINPNKPEMHDPAHHPVLGNGPLLKYNADERYATNGAGAAVWLRACGAAGVASQNFVSNNDVPCGSTIGPFVGSRLSVLTVDVGVPLLSMHSVREISSPQDVFDLSLILEGFYAGA